MRSAFGTAVRYTCVALVTAAATSGALRGAELGARMVPRRAAFEMGAPIAVDLILRNLSDAPIYVPSSYPKCLDWLGLAVKCPDLDARSAIRISKGICNDGCTMQRLDPTAEFKTVVFLNRYIRFAAPKSYRLSFSINYPRFLARVPQDGQRSHPEDGVYVCGGEFAVEIEPAPFTEDGLKALLKDWELSQDLDAAHAIEALSTVDQPFAIKHLVKLGLHKPLLRTDAVWALGQFAACPELWQALQRLADGRTPAEVSSLDSVQRGLEEFIKPHALDHVLAVYARAGDIPFDRFLRRKLASPDAGVRKQCLAFLAVCCTAERVPLDAIRPFVADKDEELADLARIILEKCTRDEDPNVEF